MANTPNSSGTFALVLHSHLPYVLSHNRLEEEWLFDAVTESYLPLLYVFRRLMRQGLSPKVTLGLTPVLLEQLADPRFPPKFLAYLEQKANAARRDHLAFHRRNAASFARLASVWEAFYERTTRAFRDDLSTDVIGALRELQDAGHIEILTSAATHAYLPLLGLDKSVEAQIQIGTQNYRRHFGRDPQGCWLPECGYRPAMRWVPPLHNIDGLSVSNRRAVDEILSANGLHYFIVDSPQLQLGESHSSRPSQPPPVYIVDGQSSSSVPSPASSAVAVFARDFNLTSQVWQHDGGYPGDPWYLEFHKKHAGGNLRYWRITDRQADLAYKQEYIPEWALDHVRAHAGHFVQALRTQLRTNREGAEEASIVVAAFDTELFGHWWFEGPEWLYEVLRHIATSADTTLATCGEYLSQHPPQDRIRLAESSWGAGNDHRVWFQDDTRSLWRDVYHAECDMQALGKRLNGQTLDAPLDRILRQGGRELFLLQSSDWPFMITRDSTPDHARARFALHYKNFTRLRAMAEQYMTEQTLTQEDERFLEEMEQQDALFPELDPTIFWQSSELALEQRAALGDRIELDRVERVE